MEYISLQHLFLYSKFYTQHQIVAILFTITKTTPFLTIIVQYTNKTAVSCMLKKGTKLIPTKSTFYNKRCLLHAKKQLTTRCEIGQCLKEIRILFSLMAIIFFLAIVRRNPAFAVAIF